MCIRRLREQGHELTGYWYNPNIHPYTEYASRKEALKTYTESVGLPMLWNDQYGLRKFTEMVVSDLENRCGKCFRERLKETALAAKAAGFDAFTSTLFISPYQKHELLKATAEEVSREVGIPFHYVDFRPDFREGQRIAREFPLYMQKYCGCIFSEEERYLHNVSQKSR
jgi:hypothetical protein